MKSLNPFYIYRNIRKCLSEGVSLLTDNFWHTVWLSLPVIVACSAILGFVVIQSGETIATDSTSMAQVVVWLALLTVAFLLLKTLIYTFLSFKVKEVPKKTLTFRRLYGKTFINLLPKALLYVVVTMALIGGVAYGIHLFLSLFQPQSEAMMVVKTVSVVMFVLLFIILFIPYQNVLPTLMMLHGNPFALMMRGWASGFRYWGKMMQMSVLVKLFVFFVSLLLASPGLIFLMVNQSAVSSAAEGDTVVLPSFYSALLVGTVFLTFVLESLLAFVDNAPFAYLHASIKVDEEEMLE